MNWDDLKITLAVAEKESILKAAKFLDVHHTTVSRRIKAFEEQLGVRIFDRLPQGYKLTEAGEKVVRSSTHIEEEVNNLERHIQGKDTRLEGDIILSLPAIIALYFAMPLIAEFMNLYPGISIKTRISDNIADLDRREADVAFRITQKPAEQHGTDSNYDD